MNRATIELEIRNTISSLIKLANNYCWNEISPNYSFILSDIIERENFSKKYRNVINDKKSPINLKCAIEFLEKEYSDLYDINFYIFKAKKQQTIIEIQYYRKSSLDKDFSEKVKNNPPMVHAKISMPVYAKNEEKFDVNWESEGVVHKWKTFIYDLKYRMMINFSKNKNR